MLKQQFIYTDIRATVEVELDLFFASYPFQAPDSAPSDVFHVKRSF
jgi:hypothetical protein